MVHRTGKKATMVATSHCAPPWMSALVIAVATSSGFIEQLLSTCGQQRWCETAATTYPARRHDSLFDYSEAGSASSGRPPVLSAYQAAMAPMIASKAMET